MKFWVIGIVVVASMFGVFALTNTSGSTEQKLTMQTIQSDIASGAALIDVRTPSEYSSGHIDGAANLPLQNMQAGLLPSTDKDKTIYVYCHSGNRSTQAAALLKKAGYQNVVNLGAMTHVQSIGGSIKT